VSFLIFMQMTPKSIYLKHNDKQCLETLLACLTDERSRGSLIFLFILFFCI